MKRHTPASIWDRDKIVNCKCKEKSWRHVHCPCAACKNKAVSRNTELRHWRESIECSGELKKQRTEISMQDDVLSQYLNEESSSSETSSLENNLVEETVCNINVTENCSSELLHIPFRQYQEDTGQDEASAQQSEASDQDQQFRMENEEISDNDANVNVNAQISAAEKELNLKGVIVDTILDAVKIMEKHGCSLAVFTDILSMARKLVTNKVVSNVDEDILNSIWPKNWDQAQKILLECGHSEAKQYFVCYCYKEKEYVRNGKKLKKKVYSGTWDLMDHKDQLCRHCQSKGEITFYYLGLGTKVTNWFKNKEMCQKMLSHWMEREHWLNKENAYPVKKELWDGKRWHALKWFWDPECGWMLPTTCLYCEEVISIDEIRDSRTSQGNNSKQYVICRNCHAEFEHQPELVRGSPLNLALIAHWDGWESVGSGYRGSGSIEVSIGNLFKNVRNRDEEVYVVEFIPAYQLPSGVPQKYDAFLKPLMDELIHGFIKGYEVSYPLLAIPDYNTDLIEKIRILLLLWTGDHPAQCEIGKLLNQGKCPCRRCKLIGQHVSDPNNNHFYYGNTRKQTRYPWQPRTLSEEIQNMLEVEAEKRPSIKKKLASEKGVTGLSLLHKYLYPLYGFNIFRDLVFDIFHLLPLNIVKNGLQYLLSNDVIDSVSLDSALMTFPWTRELKAGRLPQPVRQDHKGLRSWKAESYQKFAFPFAECALEDKIEDDNHFEILSMISRLVEMHFHSGRDGWTTDMINAHYKLAQRLNIMTEETQGLLSCTISMHNITHVHEDLMNFSASDIYWCAVFERAVKHYVKKSHNCKGLEITFSKSEMRREFLKSIEEPTGLHNNLRYDLDKVGFFFSNLIHFHSEFQQLIIYTLYKLCVVCSIYTMVCSTPICSVTLLGSSHNG